MTVLQGYRFALDPSPEQEAMLRSHCGAQRKAFNWRLGLVKANLDQRAAERSYGLGEDELTPLVGWSAYGLRHGWNQTKDIVAPWWRENSNEAYSSGLANLAAGLSNWAKSRSGNRGGARVRFPRFKSKRSAMSCRFTTGAFGLVDTDRRHVQLPRIGQIRTHESTRKPARHLERGTGRIRSATVSFTRGRWFVSFSVEVQRHEVRPPEHCEVVGVDLGITHLAVLSQPVPGISDCHGMVANPRHLEHAQRALRRLQREAARRRGPDRRTGTKPSKRWQQSNAKITKLHAKVANCRADGLHKLTTALADRFGTVVVEDLNVAGMLRNRRLARGIADAGWAELRRQLEYKMGWRSGVVAVADRWYPSSKTCNACGVVKAKLRLSDRLFCCDACGYRTDRDLNAARNLAALASRIPHSASSPSCGATKNEPDGRPGKTSFVGNGHRHGNTPEVNVA